MANQQKTNRKRTRTETGGTASDSSDSDAEVRRMADSWPAWLVVEAADTERPLSELSPFAISKGFQGIAGKLKSIKRLRNGSFLVETTSRHQSDQLLKASVLVDRPIKVSPHRALNSTKGVIKCPELKGVSELEIKQELKSQGVVEVRRALFRKGSETLPTNTLFLTFCTPTLPQSIKVGYLNVRVSLYVPSPMRCFKCQKFGHVKDRCPGQATCGQCSKEAHEGSCSSPALCINCGGGHPSSSRDCPKWRLEHQIQRVRTEKKLPFFEAKKLVLSSQPTSGLSYADVAKKLVTRSVGCQTEESGVSAPKPTMLQVKSMACGGGQKSAVPVPSRQPGVPEAAKPSPVPRSSGRSAPAGRGDVSRPAGGSAPAIVEVRKPARPSVPTKPVLKSAGPPSGRNKKGDRQLSSNRFSALEDHGADMELEEDDGGGPS